MKWYYAKNGGQQGPVSQEELASLLASGSLRPDDLVWNESLTNWVAASAVPALQSAAIPGAPPLPTNPWQANPYAAPQSTPIRAPGQPIPTYLWQSIVVSFFCCLPFGIPGIVYAAKVDGLMARGDFDGARRASDSAKMWCWISFGLGLGFGLLAFFLGLATDSTGSDS